MEMQLTCGWERGQSERDRNLAFSHLRALDFILTGVGRGGRVTLCVDIKSKARMKLPQGTEGANGRGAEERARKRRQDQDKI